uniref:CP47 apoprotein of photosystem II n=1 Tax=Pyrocystis lunula TaxID=2972 RepID=A0A2R4QHC3_PYRLU|nr:CP47 apoprotein of photosystem II [Pyrocystis lunula]
MLLYELVLLDPTDPVYNPIWRQGCFVLPWSSRLGVVKSWFSWSLGIDFSSTTYWSLEVVLAAHILLSGLLVLSAYWHWSYWDLELFIGTASGLLVLDLNRIFGIHLTLASILCMGFGIAHLTGYSGPGMWTTDSFGLVGCVRNVKPVYSLVGLTPYCYGSITSHHIAAGWLGIIIGLWHISTRPGPWLYRLLVMYNIEAVLSSSIASVLSVAAITSSCMWFGSVTSSIELVGPTRYQWDNGYFSNDIQRRVNMNYGYRLNRAFNLIPDKLVLYDYVGNNPAKGGLFRAGPIIKGDGIVQNWLGHTLFEIGSSPLLVRRMPSFFETFPVILLDQAGTVRADIPFRRAESRYSLEQTHVTLGFQGGIYDGAEYSSPSIVKSYARKAQFGELFTFEQSSCCSEGLYRTSSRCWYSFTHTSLVFIFLFGHLWHAGRSLYRDLWVGI